MKILITGGAGFIGSAVIRQYIQQTDHEIINVDALTYAGNLRALETVSENSRYCFEWVDIRDLNALVSMFDRHQPDAVMHLAAESHVDRSITIPADFIQTNIVGTFNLLEVAREYFHSLDASGKSRFRFHHVSTDEVYGDLGTAATVFSEGDAYAPSSPYAASKASADHLVRAWHRTYGLPVVISNCSNNYGPYQYPEKLIPLIIMNALKGLPLPIYGEGKQVRDWLYVEDHARALRRVLESGRIGETYNIGGGNERTNLQVARTICALLDELVPDSPHVPHESLIRFVADRLGHDFRYAIDATKTTQELGWIPKETFESGIKKAVLWQIADFHRHN